MRTIFAEYNPHRNSIDVYTSAGYMLRIDCWEAEKNLKTNIVQTRTAQQAIMEIPMSFETFFIPTSIPSPPYLISSLLCFICVNFRYFSAIHFYNCVCHFRNIQIVRYHYNRKTIFLLKFTYIIKNLSSCLFV